MKTYITFIASILIATSLFSQPPSQHRTNSNIGNTTSFYENAAKQTISGQWHIIAMALDIQIENNGPSMMARVADQSGFQYGLSQGTVVASIDGSSTGVFVFTFYNNGGQNKPTSMLLSLEQDVLIDRNGTVIIKKSQKNQYQHVERSTYNQRPVYAQHTSSTQNNYNQAHTPTQRSGNYFTAEKQAQAPQRKKKRGGFGKFIKGAIGVLSATAEVSQMANNLESGNRLSQAYSQSFSKNNRNSQSNSNPYLTDDVAGVVESFINITDNINTITGGKFDQVKESNQRLKDIYSGDIYKTNPSQNTQDSYNNYVKKSIENHDKQYGHLYKAMGIKRN